MITKINASGVLEDFQRIWDCLIAIEKIQDEHPDSYNDVISCLISKAKDIVEDGMRDIKTEGNRKSSALFLADRKTKNLK